MKKTFKRITSVLCAVILAVSMLMSTAISTSALSYNGSSSYKSGKYYKALTKVNLTGNQRTDIVNVAKSQIGYQEGSSSSELSGEKKGSKNYTEYGRWYGLQDMWCAMFVSWCANTAGVSKSIVPKHSYTPTGLSWFQSHGQAYSRAQVASGKYTPQPGDIIYFKSSRNNNTTNHVGIVTSYSKGTVYTVEGNTSSATVSTNGGAVAAKSYSITNTYIVYICKPNYKNTEKSIKLDKSSLTLVQGKSSTLKATVTGGGTVTWTSNNKSVATVTSSGKVTAVAPGTATITAKTSTGKTAKCTVKVNAATVKLSQSSLTLIKGKSSTLTATNTGSKITSWTSSDKSVATVTSSGKVTAVAVGTATITVKLANGSKDTCKVTVTNATVKLNESSLKLKKGKSYTLKATVTGGGTVTWTSSNKSVATVTSSGKVTAVAPGTATITVKLANGNKDTCKVTVTKVSYFPKCSSSQTSIIDALKSIGVDSSMNYRKKIASANGISNYKGTASQNTTLLNLLKKGKLVKP